MKISDIIASANSNLFRNKTRTFLTILAVFIGSFTIILNSAINTGVNDYIDKQLEAAGGEGYLEIMTNEAVDTISSMLQSSSEVREYREASGSDQKSTYITDEQIKKARKVPGLESIDLIYSANPEYIKAEGSDKKFAVTNLNLMPRGNVNLDTTAGRKPDANTDKLEVALTQAYVKALGFASDEDAIGKTVTFAVPNTVECYMVSSHADCLKLVDAKVVGVQAPSIMAAGGMRANLALNQKIYDLATAGMPDEAKNHAYQATAQVDPAKIDDIKKELEKIGLSAMTIDDEVGMIKVFFDAILVVFNIFGGIALLAASIGIINTLFMSVQERTREIGLMKAMGMSSGKIFFSFSCEAILLGFWGSVVGVIFSVIIGNIGDKIAHESFLKDFPTFELVKFDPLNMLIIVLVIMFIAFLAGTLPAHRAAKKDPIDALRYE
ncbi:ABC transporter permease [Candidatus Saccharibacteria bacterium]|nr:ABC transporter permease [Candidatus Saccharibacteria bacterium]